jgi:HAD superfamily hydrolase (TIGR01490 family)
MAVAFFDLDKTICSVPTEQQITKHMWKIGKVNLGTVLRVLWGFIQYNFHLVTDFAHLKRKLVNATMKDMSVRDFNEHFDYLYDNELKAKIFPEVMLQIEEHKRNNHKIVIVSTAIDQIVSKFARELGADHHYSTTLEVDNHCFTGNVIGDVYYGETKKQAVLQYCEKHNIDPKVCYAYGDYFGDRNMLEVVGNPVAINPDKRLLKIAQTRKWKVIDAIIAA